MDPYTFGPIQAVLDLAYSAVAGLAELLAPFAGTSSAAAAIAVTTMLVRLALLPAGIASARSAAAARRIGPQVAELRARFARKPERLQKELAELYRREGSSPLAGCLPLLAQLPVVGLVYALFTHGEIAGHANSLLRDAVAGVPLGASLPHTLVSGPVGAATVVTVLVIVALLVLSAELSRALMRRQAAANPVAVAAPAGLASNGTLMRALRFTPYLSIVAAAFVPLAAAIYIAVSAVWGAIERTVLARRFA